MITNERCILFKVVIQKFHSIYKGKFSFNTLGFDNAKSRFKYINISYSGYLLDYLIFIESNLCDKLKRYLFSYLK